MESQWHAVWHDGIGEGGALASVVALGADDRCNPLLCYRQEVMRTRYSSQRVDCNLDVAVGAIFEANRHRQPR